MKIIAFILVLVYTISLLYSLIKNLQRIKTDSNIFVAWTNIVTTAFMLSVVIIAFINMIKELSV
jgi:hypothetical protein